MKTVEEIKDIILDAVEFAQSKGYSIGSGSFLSYTYDKENDKTIPGKECCPLTAILIKNGYNMDEFRSDQSTWLEVINTALGAVTEEDQMDWNNIWRGYDARPGGLVSSHRGALYQLGLELQTLVPPIGRIY